MTVSAAAMLPRSRRAMTIGTITLIALIMITGVIIGRRTRREIRAEEWQILQGVRKVCKLSTVELSLADYAKKTVPKTIDLPFTKEPTAYLFYSGVVSAGFDVCDGPSLIDVSHAKREVRVRLPPPRILSVDVLRFETINEESGFLNAISPNDRNRWFSEARASLEKAADAAGALQRAQAHARDLFAGFVEPRGYSLQLTVADAPQ
ncbi:MAG TPA: DUF4230 domain-containing protein [Polyangia bacterium]|nr:DUF4230 domain-containing protein [Polyangia bacterium]